MANIIQLKRGTGSAVPSQGSLAVGELAINIDSGKLYYGSGSSVLSDFRFDKITAETYVISSSVTHMTTSFSSGSTAFGDSAGDAHTFTGDITASGDISSSGTIIANSFTGNGLSIDGPSNSHVEVGEYIVGVDYNTVFGDITGSGLIISGAMADTDHHNMLKIGNVELIDLNSAVSQNEFLIHNVTSFKMTSGSDSGDVANSGHMIEHNGADYKIYKNNVANITSAGTTTTIDDSAIQLNASQISMRAGTDTAPTYISGFSADPNTVPGLIKSTLASDFLNKIGGSVTASAVSASGNVYAADYFDGGANINTLYAPVLGGDDNYVTDAEKTVIGNTSNTNTGDETTATVNALDITEVGALADGTIASGFGNIDNGTSTLDTGVATAASLVCTAGATFGGGYGSTGATISTAGVGTFNGALTADASITAGGTLAVYAQGTTTGGRILMREGSDNGTNYIGFNAPAALTGNTAFTLPDGDGSANQVLKTDGGAVLAWTDMSGGTVGWHGSGTRIKILASDFIGDDGGRPQMIDDSDQANENFFIESYASNTLYVTMAIPTGYTATHVMIYGSATDAVEVWEHQINSKTGVSKGTGNVDTEIDITDVASSTTNYLFIQVANASGNEIHGGYITIAES
jgi:fibronectin-binding autotransporter adhesin